MQSQQLVHIGILQGESMLSYDAVTGTTFGGAGAHPACETIGTHAESGCLNMDDDRHIAIRLNIDLNIAYRAPPSSSK